MTSALLPRKVIIMAIILPIALLVGYLLTDIDLTSIAILGVLALGLCIPFILRSHHALLVFSWNAAISIYVLPGQPHLWMLVAGVSLLSSLASRLILKKDTNTYVPSVVWPLLALTLVVLGTAQLTGGIGLRILGGSSYGGKRYIYFIAAVIGYFALCGVRTPKSKVGLYSGLYFLSPVTYAISHLLYWLGPSFWFLYSLFPTGGVVGYQTQAAETGLLRLTGLSFAGMGVCQLLLCRFGIQGLLMLGKPWRLGLFLVAFFTMLLGGFRGYLLLLAILCVIQFFLEGIYKKRIAVPIILVVVLSAVLIVPFATKLPMAAQRALAFLPIEINPIARADAIASTEWRLRMWQVLSPEVPKHFWFGKGSSINPSDLYLASEAVRRGQAEDFESSLVSGDYHSAVLTVMIHFGIWGLLAFLWFCVASGRVLHRYYMNSPPELKLCNTFIYAYFLAQVICFFLVAGTFAEHFFHFTGILGLAVSINGNGADTRRAALPA